jgi:hypothetical protein
LVTARKLHEYIAELSDDEWKTVSDFLVFMSELSGNEAARYRSLSDGEIRESVEVSRRS